MRPQPLTLVGVPEGWGVGLAVGDTHSLTPTSGATRGVGSGVGDAVGSSVGLLLGRTVGYLVGYRVGSLVGRVVGDLNEEGPVSDQTRKKGSAADTQ
jgi:hypothetical protein